MNNSVYAVIGGDERCGILCGMLSAAGNRVFAAGFEKYGGRLGETVCTDALNAAAIADKVILPYPVSRDGGKTVYAPFSGKDIVIDSELADILCHSEVYAGGVERLVRQCPMLEKVKFHDYSAYESFLERNAYATAEAIVMLAIGQLPTILKGVLVLITGFGRIGRNSAELFAKMGAEVYCATHTESKLDEIRERGYSALTYPQAAEITDRIGLAVNTADAVVLDRNIISRMNKNALIIDAASAPGGTDFDAAKEFGIKAALAPGLPGKYSPVTAAEIIYDAVAELSEEEHS